jgi:hypothetical protein
MRSCDPLASVIAPVPDQLPAIPAKGLAPWAKPVPTLDGVKRPTTAAKAATLSAAIGTKRRVIPSRTGAQTGGQAEFVIEVSIPTDEVPHYALGAAQNHPTRWLHVDAVHNITMAPRPPARLSTAIRERINRDNKGVEMAGKIRLDNARTANFLSQRMG